MKSRWMTFDLRPRTIIIHLGASLMANKVGALVVQVNTARSGIIQPEGQYRETARGTELVRAPPGREPVHRHGSLDPVALHRVPNGLYVTIRVLLSARNIKDKVSARRSRAVNDCPSKRCRLAAAAVDAYDQSRRHFFAAKRVEPLPYLRVCVGWLNAKRTRRNARQPFSPRQFRMQARYRGSGALYLRIGSNLLLLRVQRAFDATPAPELVKEPFLVVDR
jgi:hypothetical protein